MNFPKLCVIVGVPGSGKTTYCESIVENNSNFKHLSSDLIRKEILGSEEDQSANERVFHIMQTRALEYLNAGYNVLYDATNITRKSRAAILSKLPLWVQKEAIICWAPIETCIERDKNRKRSVGKEVIAKMLRNYQVPYFDEGFSRITVKHPEGWPEQEQEYKNLKDVQDLYYAAMWHDIGKKYCKSFINAKGEKTDVAHYYGHQGYSAWIVNGLLISSNDIAWLVNNHMDPYLDTKYYRNLPLWLKTKIDIIHEADVYAH